MSRIYVTGHRNPDTDSIASAIGYAELRQRLDGDYEYVPVRLGELNEQTRWVLERSGAPEPRLLPHVLLRAQRRDAGAVPAGAAHEAGARRRPDDGGREPRPRPDRRRRRHAGRASSPSARWRAATSASRARPRGWTRRRRSARSPTCWRASCSTGAPTGASTGRVWVLAMATSARCRSASAAGDVVVVGDRDDAQRVAIEVGVALLVTQQRHAAARRRARARARARHGGHRLAARLATSPAA